MSNSEEKLEFIVVESWKGTYKTGDIFVARSVGMTTCHSTVPVGEELLVGFNDLAAADFTVSACPEYFPELRRKLEDRYLQRLSKKHKTEKQSAL